MLNFGLLDDKILNFLLKLRLGGKTLKKFAKSINCLTFALFLKLKIVL